MQNNQSMLVAVIFALVIVVGLLAYDRHAYHESAGEKVGHAIDRAIDKVDDGVRR